MAQTHLHRLVFVATSNAAFVSGGSVGPEKADAQHHQVVSWQLSKQPQETRDIYSVTAQHTDSPLSHLKTLLLPGDSSWPQSHRKRKASRPSGLLVCTSARWDPHEGHGQPAFSLAFRPILTVGDHGAGEMAQWLGTLTALPEDLG